jgi:hypothetical protein
MTAIRKIGYCAAPAAATAAITATVKTRRYGIDCVDSDYFWFVFVLMILSCRFFFLELLQLLTIIY